VNRQGRPTTSLGGPSNQPCSTTSEPPSARSARPPPSRPWRWSCWRSASAPAPPSSQSSMRSSFRGLPFDEHDRIVAVLEHDPKRATSFGSGSTTTQTYLDWRAQQQSFEALALAGNTTCACATREASPGCARAARHPRVLRRVACLPGARPRLHQRRRSERTAQGRHPQRRLLATSLRGATTSSARRWS